MTKKWSSAPQLKVVNSNNFIAISKESPANRVFTQKKPSKLKERLVILNIFNDF